LVGAPSSSGDPVKNQKTHSSRNRLHSVEEGGGEEETEKKKREKNKWRKGEDRRGGKLILFEKSLFGKEKYRRMRDRKQKKTRNTRQL